MKLHEIIFPRLKGKWGEVNLNEVVKNNVHFSGATTNPLLDPKMQGLMLSDLHTLMEVNYSYGGWLEDRSTLWKGHYHEPDKMIHLGIDYNVPVNTKVHLPFDGQVCGIIRDGDQFGGWGGRIDFKADGFYFILAHLAHLPIVTNYVQMHQQIKKGSFVGFVGDSYENGGWFPHLHLQCVSTSEYEAHVDLMKIDGYGGGEDLDKRYPNPEKITE